MSKILSYADALRAKALGQSIDVLKELPDAVVWETWSGDGLPRFEDYLDFRVTPVEVRFRVALMQSETRYTISVDSEEEEESVKRSVYFREWLTGWETRSV